MNFAATRPLGALLLAVLACCTPPPSSAPVDVAVTDITVGRELGPDGSLAEGARTNLFWTTDVFYVDVALQGTANDLTVQARWTGPDGAVAAEASHAATVNGSTVVTLQAPPQPDGRWPAGDYKVEILLAGASQGTRDLNAR